MDLFCFIVRRFAGARRTLWAASGCIATCFYCAHPAPAEEPPDLVWSRVIASGPSDDDLVNGLAVDGQGNAVIVGQTEGVLASSSVGFIDAYIASYNPLGERQWIRQFGASSKATALEDVVVGPAGEWLTVGTARHQLGSAYHGGRDVFVRRYSAGGGVNWTMQLGTTSNDDGRSIAASGSSVYVAGDTYGALEGTNAGGNDAFAARYLNFVNAATHTWTSQNGTDDWDLAYDIAYDRGRVFVAGETFGNFNGPNIELTDAYLLSYDSDGNFQWARQYGNQSEPQGAYAVATDGANAVYIAGYTYVNSSWAAGGAPDGFLAKYDLNGNFQWQRYFATNVWDTHTSLATDAAGNIYVGGYTGQQLLTPNEASALVLKYSPAGDLVWQKEVDVGITNRTTDIAVSPDGNRIWIAGNYWNSGTDLIAKGFLALLAMETLPGDYDQNGTVGANDFAVWKAHFGTSHAAADGNGDGTVDAADYTIWRDNFLPAGGSGGVTSVPEPTSMALFGLALLGAIGFMRNRRIPVTN